MKRTLSVLMLCLAVFAFGAFAADKVEAPESCKYCGMDRTKFAHSRMLVEYEDGTSTGTCSLHCLAVEFATNLDKPQKSIMVADFAGKQLLDAEKAVWVIGGNKPGVMTKTAKWAFADEAKAEEFIKENGGSIARFEEAIKAAYADMYDDTRMIRERRLLKRMNK